MNEASHEPCVHKIEIQLPNRMGLQLRLAVQFAKCMQQFNSSIQVQKGKMLADGKNIMELLILAATWKSRLQVVATGEDAVQAIDEAREFFLKQKR